MDGTQDGEEFHLVDLFSDCSRRGVESLQYFVEKGDGGAVLEREVSEFGRKVDRLHSVDCVGLEFVHFEEVLVEDSIDELGGCGGLYLVDDPLHCDGGFLVHLEKVSLLLNLGEELEVLLEYSERV